jgi:hypothetical protein
MAPYATLQLVALCEWCRRMLACPDRTYKGADPL